jgi:hypothetical protein
MTVQYSTAFDPLFGEADGYGGDGYDADGNDRNGYDRDGNPKSVPVSDLNLTELWGTFTSQSTFTPGKANMDAFLAYLREITREPEYIGEVVFCTLCGDPAWHDETSRARGAPDAVLCQPCADDCDSCDRCAELYPPDELSDTLDSRTVCENCRDENYTWCEECEGHYPDVDSDEHDHEEENDMSGCCESPQLKFKIRNDGCEPLANDKRATVTLPTGIISAEGLSQIRTYLRIQANEQNDYASRVGLTELSYDLLEHLGDEWQTRTGNFTKRMSRHAYKAYGLKLSPEILSQVGCIARDNCGNQNSYDIEVTRDLNLSAAAFYHEDSCWWGGYSESRCALKTNGGFGMRTFDRYGDIAFGRAWVMPLKLSASGHLEPTFNTETPDAFIVFNGYGDLAGYNAPRIVGHMAGWTYRKIGFDASPMYINAGGYLVAPEEIAKKYDGESNYLTLRLSQHSDLYYRERADAQA